ncbi:hypothetical protein [Rhizobium leucaenae]|uniref:hypothetical protein n=1 Tax=Rhizobium leucaenae TaxID=29450 RepID=UPI00160E7060|nr:hypothetical protein [Rhizobium leucaenae]MBB6299414.1 hypothetical protein [Rhizobium leucaenae]
MITLSKFEPFYHVSDFATTVARFDVSIGDIIFRQASLRYRNDTYAFVVGLPGRRKGVGLLDPSPTRDAIMQAAMARYRAWQDALPIERGGWIETLPNPPGTDGPPT